MELKKQGLDPGKFIADFGNGLREGISNVYEDMPCNGDVFHVLYYLNKMTRYFKNAIRSRKSYLQKLKEKFKKAMANLANDKNVIKARTLMDKIDLVEEDIDKFELLAENTSTLVSWMMHDILSVAEPNKETRIELYDFILDELKKLEQLHPHRIKGAYTFLKDNKPEILAFVDDLEQEFSKEEIRKKLGENQYILLLGLVVQIITSTFRASSIIENLNGRIKPYFELRKHMGRDFNELLRFFINHTPLSCSRKKERKNKTPSELLMKQKHSPWFEMLGFKKTELCKIPA